MCLVSSFPSFAYFSYSFPFLATSEASANTMGLGDPECFDFEDEVDMDIDASLMEVISWILE